MTTTATKSTAPSAPPPAKLPTPPPAKTTATIDFTTATLGTRPMRVNALTPEQLAVYQRTASRFARDVDNTMSADDARKALDRSMRIVVSPLADPVDVEWVEDQFLDGTLTLVEAASILTLTIEAFATGQAPTTGPPPKTARARRAR